MLRRTNTAPSALRQPETSASNSLWNQLEAVDPDRLDGVQGSNSNDLQQAQDVIRHDDVSTSDAEELSLLTQSSTDQTGEFLDLDFEDDSERLERVRMGTLPTEYNVEQEHELSKRGKPSSPPSNTGHHYDSPFSGSFSDSATMLRQSQSGLQLRAVRSALSRPYKSEPDVATDPITVHVRTDTQSDARSLAGAFDELPLLLPKSAQSEISDSMWGNVSVQSSVPSDAASSVAGERSLDCVRKRLVAWSWDREKDEAPSSSSSRVAHHDDIGTPRSWDTYLGYEEPPTPPNTRKASAMTSPSLSMPRFSLGLATPESLSSDPSPDRLTPNVSTPKREHPINEEAHSHAEKNASTSLVPYTASMLSRQLSTMAEEESFLKTHRDSVDLAHERLDAERHTKPNPLLSAARDSMIISKQRFERYPRPHVATEPRNCYVKPGGLSPILDASPPDAPSQFLDAEHQRKRHVSRKTTPEIGGHPERDCDCPICEVERPRNCDNGTHYEREW